MIWRDGIQVVGPAFLVSVAYLDPGNWATAIESGSRFGYRQLWVLVLANLIAIQLQILSSRLGLVSGKHLAQVCRDSYPPIVCRLLWLMTEISIVALDLTMVLGTAVGLNLLFKIDPVTCILLTTLDVLALFLLVPQTAVSQAEQWTAVLVFAVLGCFVIDLFISRPPLGAVISGLAPSIQREDLYTAVSLLGANIMPHNFYLHSALVAGQSSRDDKVTARRCYLNSLDVACALGLALLVNVAVLLVAASAFHAEGVQVATLQEAHDLLEQILNSHLAPLAFGLALLLTGQMSTFTSTIAGQVVISGFLGVSSSTLTRRLSTRALAVLPALYVQINYGTEGTYKMLVVAQVVLAMQLPFTLIPLIKATSSHSIMGSFASSWVVSMTAWASSAAVSIANVLMILDVLWKEASQSAVDQAAEPRQQTFTEWLPVALMSMMQSPRHLLSTFGVAAFTGCALALLMWMGVHPVSVRGSLRSSSLKFRSSCSELDAWQSADSQNDLETGSVELTTACAGNDVHPSHYRCDRSESDAPTTFVQRLFADLPMEYVWRAIASLRGAMLSKPVHAPLTPKLLAIHTSSMQSLQIEGEQGPLHHLRAPATDSSSFVPRMFFNPRTRSHLQAMHARRSEDAMSIAPSIVSDISVGSAHSLMGRQSLHSTATQATEPGGGKGHRMGRAARKQFAASVCRTWEKHFDAHGRPLRCGKVCTTSRTTSQVQQPDVFCSSHRATLTVCQGLEEVKQVAGIESLLEQVSEGVDALSRSPSHSLFSQPLEPSTRSTIRLSRLAGLGEQLTLYATVVNAACACSQQLQSAMSSAANHTAEVSLTASGQQISSMLASPDWQNIAGKMCQTWNHMRVQDEEVDCLRGSCPSTHSVGCATSDMQTCSGRDPSRTDAAHAAGVHDFGLQRWNSSFSDSTTAGRGKWGDSVNLSPGMVDSWPNLLLITFGVWCMAALLQLASVEPRPELWGRYSAALNHLQGVLFMSLSLSAQIQGISWSPAGWVGNQDIAAMSVFGMNPSGGKEDLAHLISTGRDLEAMHKELLHLIHMVDAHVNSSGAPHQKSASTTAAFAKGKVNILSVIKRLRSHVLSIEQPRVREGTHASSTDRQDYSKVGDSSWGSGRWQHRTCKSVEWSSTRAFGPMRSPGRSSSPRATSTYFSPSRHGPEHEGSRTRDRW